MKKEIRDCHYCEYACCDDADGWCDCYVEDGAYFSHHVVDSKKEAEKCEWFEYCDVFPKD